MFSPSHYSNTHDIITVLQGTTCVLLIHSLSNLLNKHDVTTCLRQIRTSRVRWYGEDFKFYAAYFVTSQNSLKVFAVKCIIYSECFECYAASKHMWYSD